MRKLNNYGNIFAKSLIVVFCSFALFACLEDKGNYEYSEINSIEISGIDQAYSAILGTRFQLTPELKFSIDGSADSCKYEWHYCGETRYGSTYRSTAVLSKEKNLNIIVGGPIKAEGSYRILYCVTNLTTGIRYDAWFDLVVRERMSNGYIMLCERENNSFDIDLISVYNDTLTQYHNMLDFYGSELPRTGKPLDLVCYCDGTLTPMVNDPYPNAKKYAIWILTDQRTERVRMENFEWRPEFNISALSVIPEKFMQGDNLMAEKMSAYVSNSANNGINYILFKGNWYWYNWPGGRTYFYISPINAATSTSAPYKTAPYICMSATRTAVVFNEDENRFEWQNASSGSATTTTLRTNRFTTDPAIFNWENPNYRPVYMDNRQTNTGFAVVKDIVLNRYELLLMDLNKLNAPPTKLAQGVFPALPAGVAMEDFKFFAYHNSLPYLFCATEDKVYRINTDVMATWVDVTANIVPAGHKISKLKNSAVRFAGANSIVVATYDPNGQPGKNGQLALYDVADGSGNLTIGTGPWSLKENGEYNTDLKWSGFGKIINVDYKEPK